MEEMKTVLILTDGTKIAIHSYGKYNEKLIDNNLLNNKFRIIKETDFKFYLMCSGDRNNPKCSSQIKIKKEANFNTIIDLKAHIKTCKNNHEKDQLSKDYYNGIMNSKKFGEVERIIKMSTKKREFSHLDLEMVKMFKSLFVNMKEEYFIAEISYHKNIIYSILDGQSLKGSVIFCNISKFGYSQIILLAAYKQYAYVGSKLLLQVKAECKRQGRKVIIVWSDVNSKIFYEKNGYSEIPECKEREDILERIEFCSDSVLMWMKMEIKKS